MNNHYDNPNGSAADRQSAVYGQGYTGPALHPNNAGPYGTNQNGIKLSKSKNKKIAVAVITFAVLVLTVVVIVIINSGANSSPERLVKSYFKAMSDGDAVGVAECMTECQLRSVTNGKSDDTRFELMLAFAEKAEKSGFQSENIELLDVKEAIDDTETIYEYISDVQKGKYYFTEPEIMSIKEYKMMKATYLSEGSSSKRELYVVCINMGGDWFILDMD